MTDSPDRAAIRPLPPRPRSSGGPLEESSRRPVIEVRIDTIQLVLAVAIVTFLAGVWLYFHGRPAGPAPAATASAGRTSGGSINQDEDVSKGLSYFDRSASSTPRASSPSSAPGASPSGASPRAGNDRSRSWAPVPPATDPAGVYAVQVFAGGRRAAEDLKGRLEARGYPVRLVPAGHDQAKLRVGNYRTRSDAEAVSRRITESERMKTWIVPAR